MQKVDDPALLRDLAEERAAIIEHEAREPRLRAEALAAQGLGFTSWQALLAATEGGAAPDRSDPPAG